MVQISTLVDLYITLNILIIIGYVVWYLSRFLMTRMGFRHAYSTQLRLLNGLLLTVIASPLLVYMLYFFQVFGLNLSAYLNLSDLVVSHYLNGGINMKATEFERVMSFRVNLTDQVANTSSWFAWLVLTTFFLGAAIGVLRIFFSAGCLYKIVSQSYAWRAYGRIKIRLSDHTLVPFSTRSLRNYYIVIPSHMVIQNHEFKVSVAHELQHLRQGDISWEILLELLKPVFFLNPVFHVWKKQVEELRELSCDSEVLRRGRINISDYCETLLSVCQKRLRRDRAFLIAFPKVTLVTADRVSEYGVRKNLLSRRIISLFEAKKTLQTKTTTVMFMVPLVVFLSVVTIAIQKSGDWSQDRLMLSTVVNLERLETINAMSAVPNF